jgi:hypothetical protein
MIERPQYINRRQRSEFHEYSREALSQFYCYLPEIGSGVRSTVLVRNQEIPIRQNEDLALFRTFYMNGIGQKRLVVDEFEPELTLDFLQSPYEPGDEKNSYFRPVVRRFSVGYDHNPHSADEILTGIHRPETEIILGNGLFTMKSNGRVYDDPTEYGKKYVRNLTGPIRRDDIMNQWINSNSND